MRIETQFRKALYGTVLLGLTVVVFGTGRLPGIFTHGEELETPTESTPFGFVSWGDAQDLATNFSN
jgi:hypothetical protein